MLGVLNVIYMTKFSSMAILNNRHFIGLTALFGVLLVVVVDQMNSNLPDYRMKRKCLD